ncbi:unnamed protein product [Closterium sp. NIES-53]
MATPLNPRFTLSRPHFLLPPHPNCRCEWPSVGVDPFALPTHHRHHELFNPPFNTHPLGPPLPPFLFQWIRSLSPLTTVVVEMDAPLNSPFFLPRFRAALRVFSSIFASLDAALPRDSPHRHTCERLYFARDIVNVVACEGIQRTVRAESLEQWQARMRRAGFIGLEVGEEVMEELRGVLRKGGRKYGGYVVLQQGNGVRLLWEGVPVLAASMWL